MSARDVAVVGCIIILACFIISILKEDKILAIFNVVMLIIQLIILSLTGDKNV